MSSSKPLTISNFISIYLNSNIYVRPSKIDSILKAIITYNRSPILKEYLNILRIIYFLNKLEIEKIGESRRLKSKFLTLLS